MWGPTALLSILTVAVASASPLGSLQRRVVKEVVFNTGQTFILQPSNTPFISLWAGVDTYFQGDGNLVTSVLSHLKLSPYSYSFIHSRTLPMTNKLTQNSYDPNAIWSSGTGGHNCGTSTCRLAWQGDGNFVIYINGVAVWNTGTEGKGELLTFTSQSYAIEITGVESEGSAPLLWHASDTGNENDPGPAGPGACGGVDCFSCTNCVVTSNPD